MRFMQALHSPIRRAPAITWERRGPHRGSPAAYRVILAPSPPDRPLWERSWA